MTDRIDTARLRELAEAATPGPWVHEWVDGDDWWAVYGQPTGDMVYPEVCTTWSSDEAAYIAAVNPAVVPALVAEIERLTGEPTEDEVEVGAKEIWRWFVGSSLDGFYRHAYAYDREKCMDACRAALRAARGLS